MRLVLSISALVYSSALFTVVTDAEAETFRKQLPDQQQTFLTQFKISYILIAKLSCMTSQVTDYEE